MNTDAVYKQVELVGVSAKSFERAVHAARSRAELMWCDLKLIRRAVGNQAPQPSFVAEVTKLEMISEHGEVNYRATLRVSFMARATLPPPRKKSGFNRLFERLSQVPDKASGED